jgi:glycosyltransferase involved in cell wall biosynthesis
MSAKVSVIIPTRNRACYVGGAVASVLRQSFGDTEVLVIDDASEDNTAEVVGAFCDARIRYIRHPKSRGGSATRNTGIRNAVAPLIAFLDDDDEWLPQKLERQVSLLESTSNDVGCVFTSLDIMDKDLRKKLRVRVAHCRGDLRQTLLDGNVVGTTSTILMRKSCLDKVGLFDEDLPSMQDYDLWLRIAQVYKFECIEDPLVRYRVHGTSISGSLNRVEQGLRRLLVKHGSPKRLKRTCSRLLLDVGVGYAESGLMRDASRTLGFSVLLNPLDPVCYFHFGCTWLGKKGYRRAQKLKKKVLDAVRSIGLSGLPTNSRGR